VEERLVFNEKGWSMLVGLTRVEEIAVRCGRVKERMILDEKAWREECYAKLDDKKFEEIWGWKRKSR
jgi:hypothetical protein